MSIEIKDKPVTICNKEFILVPPTLSFNIAVSKLEGLEDQADLVLDHLNKNCKANPRQKDLKLLEFLDWITLEQFNELFELLGEAKGNSLRAFSTN